MISSTIDNSKHFNIEPTTSIITLANLWDHLMARVGWRRNHHRVKPGLYFLGNPTEDSPVFVTANYTLSFNALRSSLDNFDCYIMVLNTEGINVWCAAGKGTFGTDELVNRIESTRLPEVVRHRALILPQLGASGVAAHEVKKRSGFKVEFGPVRAVDLPEYLKNHQATPEMRQVHFTFRDRLTLISVEFFYAVLPILILLAVIGFLRTGTFGVNFREDAYIITAFLAGVVLFPALLPWIPTSDFSTKGFILGGLVALPFALLRVFSHNPDIIFWRQICEALNIMLLVPPITAFLSLNFTGSTTFTSRSGVRREIFKYIPIMASMFVSGIVLAIILKLI